MSSIFESYRIFFRMLMELACIVITPITVLVFVGIILSGYISYKFILQIKKDNVLISAVLKNRLKIIFLVFPISLMVLILLQLFISVIFSFFPLPENFIKYIPLFINVFFSIGWIFDERLLYLFSIDAYVYFFIISSFYEIDILKEKFKNTYPKKQIIKAVLYSNIPVCIMVMGYYFYMFHSQSVVIK